MTAIVTRQNTDGTFDDVGMNNRYLTSHYKTLQGLKKHGIADRFTGANVRLELFYTPYEKQPYRTLIIYAVKRQIKA